MKADNIHCPECRQLFQVVSHTITCSNKDCVLYETFFQIPELYPVCFKPLKNEVKHYTSEEMRPVYVPEHLECRKE